MQLPRERLKCIRNIGPTSLEEIDAQLALYHARVRPLTHDKQRAPKSTALIKSQPAIQPHQSTPPIEYAPQPSPDEWRKTFGPLATDQTPIGKLLLSEGFQQRLVEAGFNTMADLAQATSYQLLDLPRVGGRSLSKLRTALISYMLEAESPFDEPLEKDEVSSGVSHRQIALAALVLPDMVTQLAEAPLDLIPVDRLALNSIRTNELYQARTCTVGQLVDFSSYLSGSDPVLVTLKEYLANTAPDQLVRDALPADVLEQYQSRKIADVAFWLSLLEERERFILEKHYGLYCPILTLQEIGQRLNVTRERVRQLEKRAFRQLRQKHSAAIDSIAYSLANYICECGGVITLVEAIAWLQEQPSQSTQMNLKGAVFLIAALTDGLQYLSRFQVFLHNDLSAKLLTTTQAALAELLETRLAPTAVDVLIDDFRATPAFQSARSFWSDAIGFELDAFILASLRTGEFVEWEPGVYALRRWNSRIGDNIVVALREIGEPAHFTDIAKAVNLQLPPDQQTTARNVHATMLRYEDVFTRVGNGTYALVEWNLKKDDSIAETAARILRKAGHPLHIDTITDEVLTSWQVNPNTVYMALHEDGYYRENSGLSDLCLLLGNSVFSLSEWEAARTAEENPMLPYCPPILPDPPDFESALFESVMVANKKLAAAPQASVFLAGMFAWAGYDGEPKRWLQQGVLNSYYLVGLLPYTYIFGGEDPHLRSVLLTGPISEVRDACLMKLTQRLAHMPAFWWLLRQHAPVRQKELAAAFLAVRDDGLDDTGARLNILAGLGAIARGEDYYYRLTPLGSRIADALGVQPTGLLNKLIYGENLGSGGLDDLLDFGLLE